MKNTKLTSVKILESLYHQFKLDTLDTKMTLQKITNRSLYLYLNDEKFKDLVENTDSLTISGSNL